MRDRAWRTSDSLENLILRSGKPSLTNLHPRHHKPAFGPYLDFYLKTLFAIVRRRMLSLFSLHLSALFRFMASNNAAGRSTEKSVMHRVMTGDASYGCAAAGRPSEIRTNTIENLNMPQQQRSKLAYCFRPYY
jgi:hypothetical protein